ncbi:MAG: pilus assembly protein TadG-related protein [Anaerolineae bacterium]
MYNSERGQSLVVVALVLVALVGMTALVIDVGNAYVQRRRMQNAADSAALAGARMLTMGQVGSVATVVQDYAVHRNGAQMVTHTVLASSVRVTVSEAFPTFFASIVGIGGLGVSARAEAGYFSVCEWQGNLMPIALHRDAIAFGRDIQIWDSDQEASRPGSGIVADGQRGWLNFDGGSVDSNELAGWVRNGWNGPVTVGMWINGTPGTKTAALQDMNMHVGHTVYVPIYDETRSGQNGNGQLDYRIVAFGVFQVKGVKDTGNPKYVLGEFRREIAPAEMVREVCNTPSFDSGLRVVKLVR